MKKTGIYWTYVVYPFELSVFRLGPRKWRFNAQDLDTAQTASYGFEGDDTSAYEEFTDVKRGKMCEFKNWS